jgi:hypothetical protein
MRLLGIAGCQRAPASWSRAIAVTEMRVSLLVAGTGNVKVNHGAPTQQGDNLGFNGPDFGLEAFSFITG